MDGEIRRVKKLLTNGVHPSAADSAGYTALVSTVYTSGVNETTASILHAVCVLYTV